jgi:shikimate dehydrogenase
VWALRDAGAAEVRVWNRTAARAQALAAQLGARPVSDIAPADVLVNCTAVGLRDADDPFKLLPLTADDLSNYRCVVDFVYREKDTRLLHAARQRSVAVVDGLELLVGQGALSFHRFTGIAAPVQAMRAAARGR